MYKYVTVIEIQHDWTKMFRIAHLSSKWMWNCKLCVCVCVEFFFSTRFFMGSFRALDDDYSLRKKNHENKRTEKKIQMTLLGNG